MSSSRPSTPPSASAPPIPSSSLSSSNHNPSFSEYSPTNTSSIMSFPPSSNMQLFFPPRPGSFSLNSWPTSLSSETSSLGSLSGRSIDESHPFTPSDGDAHPTSGGSFSFPTIVPPSSGHGSGSISHPFIQLPFFPDRSLGFGSQAGEGGPSNATGNSGTTSSQSGHTPIPGLASMDSESEHIGGEPRPPRWLYGAPPGSQFRTSGSGEIPNFPSFTMPYYQLDPQYRPQTSNGSVSAASTKSETEETHETASEPGAAASRDDDEEGEESDLYDDEEAPPPPRRRGTPASAGGQQERRQHRGTGRKRIEIKPIPIKLKRQITFSKRKTGLLKKVRELTTLTQTEALVILVSETGNPHSFATKSFQEMIRGNNIRKLVEFLDTEEKRSKREGKH